jgi:hypothetical protein
MKVVLKGRMTIEVKDWSQRQSGAKAWGEKRTGLRSI